MPLSLPRGFRVTGRHCGLKRNPANPDLTLVVADAPAVAAGVYTQNVVCAAPVVFDRARTPSERFRVLVINSGNANACTGEQGFRDTESMARVAAEACGVEEDSALVLSTGIIGEPLPMEKITAGIRAAADELGTDGAALEGAARGMLTTDRAKKMAGRQVDLPGGPLQITGLAKGAGMIGPNMATMLGVVMTDASLSADAAQRLLGEVADTTFNCIRVDGHTSTNDSLLLLASGAAGGAPLEGESLTAFGDALTEVCGELARAIPADGEGATHLITIEVEGCASVEAARQIGRTVADSPLVKTAVAGADPNWGRIVSAAGYAGVPFDPRGVTLHVNGHLLYERGAPVDFDAAAVSTAIRDDFDTHVALRFSEGNAAARFWASDLTAEYVRINAEYHT